MSRQHLKLEKRRWRILRREILDRDRWRCKACGRAGRLEADHIRALHLGGNAYEKSNLQMLCKGCHIAKTRKENRKVDPARDRWEKFVSEMF